LSFIKAKKYLLEKGYANRIIVPAESTATVPLAAKALGTSEAEIAKSLTFLIGEQPIMIIVRGDARIQNHKYKTTFGKKAVMIPRDAVERLIGHESGGVCPFGINKGVKVYLDVSLKPFAYVYPAAGDDHSGVKLTPEELYQISNAESWVDVCKQAEKKSDPADSRVANTLNYYNENAEEFCENTRDVDFSSFQDRFMNEVTPGGNILDLGCGSGRDSLAFLQHGYKVTAVDGSSELCRLASKLIGRNVICADFREYRPDRVFDGIWACASLLHLPRDDIRETISGMTPYLKEGGCFYLSFKYGTFSGIRKGLLITDMTEQPFRDMINTINGLAIKDIFITNDVRKDRSAEKWLNVFLKKTG
jgi:prolyl-tRNA editing enzyme YbaK/EbsC (Cys-tRNA(Pro) deacylase)/phospholipid N-methyltransferase